MKLTVSVTGDKAAAASLQRLGTHLPRLALDRTAEELEEYIEGEAGKHSKTGKLFASIYKRRMPDGWELGHDLQVAQHALFVHWGAKPHLIKPKNKKALRWPAGGAFRFAKVVKHPGYRGDPWLTRAAARAPQIFQRYVEALLAQEAGNAAALPLR